MADGRIERTVLKDRTSQTATVRGPAGIKMSGTIDRRCDRSLTSWRRPYRRVGMAANEAVREDAIEAAFFASKMP
jgi:hypothetical protein